MKSLADALATRDVMETLTPFDFRFRFSSVLCLFLTIMCARDRTFNDSEELIAGTTKSTGSLHDQQTPDCSVKLIIKLSRPRKVDKQYHYHLA
jgi:hypothetical protein